MDTPRESGTPFDRMEGSINALATSIVGISTSFDELTASMKGISKSIRDMAVTFNTMSTSFDRMAASFSESSASASTNEIAAEPERVTNTPEVPSSGGTSFTFRDIISTERSSVERTVAKPLIRTAGQDITTVREPTPVTQPTKQGTPRNEGSFTKQEVTTTGGIFTIYTAKLSKYESQNRFTTSPRDGRPLFICHGDIGMRGHNLDTPASITLSPAILNAHKHQMTAKNLELSDRELVLLISHAYAENKQPGDLNPSHFKLFERMFTTQGMIRSDRRSKGEPAIFMAFSPLNRLVYIAIHSKLFGSPAQRVARMNGLIKDKDLPGMVMLLIVESPSPPPGSMSKALKGLNFRAFHFERAFDENLRYLSGTVSR